MARDFVPRQTVGYEAYAKRLAREYAVNKPGMIIVGGASMYKHRRGWRPGRAIATLPALTGRLGVAGSGFGPRHRSLIARLIKSRLSPTTR